MDASQKSSAEKPEKEKDVYSPDASLKDLFGDATGQALLDMIFKTYQVAWKHLFLLSKSGCSGIARVCRSSVGR